ncbi:probable glutamate receptor [Centruroides sculpturatus]|uniref:probable glutamate receptor n=1 Tax=Centruroides sculpturatus TaxID=218467 RepID=UPI000C6DA89B|nr:probable glutamate receptor [Centruroides sculpturatus]
MGSSELNRINLDTYAMRIMERDLLRGTNWLKYSPPGENMTLRRYELVTPITQWFGSKDKNGSWKGMIGQIATKEADFSFVPVYITYDRFAIVHYSSPLMFSQGVFVLRSPERKPNLSAIYKPFSKELWIIIIVVAILYALTVFPIINKDLSLHGNDKLWSKRKMFWFIFKTFTNQGDDLTLFRSFPSRFVIGIWLLTTVTLVWSYTGVLMSFLTCPFVNPVPRTFFELSTAIENGEYEVGIEKYGAITKLLFESKSRHMKIIAENVISRNNFYTYDTAMKRMMKDYHFAFIGGNIILRSHMDSLGASHFRMSEDIIATYTMSYAMKLGFPYKNKVNKIIARLFESGISNRQINFKLPENNEESAIHPLVVEILLSPFLLLVSGYILSTVIFAIEMMLRKINKNKTGSLNI